MKATKFLPLALVAIMLTPAAFAAGYTGSTSQSDTYTLTVGEYFDIKKRDSITTSLAEFSEDYAQITLSTPPSTTFDVYTNLYGKLVYLQTECQTGTTSTKAIGGTNEAPIIAFGNTNPASGTKPTATEVSSALGASPEAAENANVIAFKLNPTITPDTSTGATAPTVGTIDTAKGQIPYTLHNGKTTFKYAVNATAETGTFSLHDEKGSYVAKVTFTSTAL